MASWSAIEAEAPELTALAREFLDAFVHKTLATLRRDGAPRISGSEVIFAEGELWLGSMWQSLKARDLQRDARFALHSGSPDPDGGWRGDAKLAGRAEENVDEQLRERVFGGKGGAGPSHLFRCDITELVVVSLPDPPEFLVIDAWHEGRGVTRRERR
ncbi:MAG: pyridoxamine 5'-phosphate oxidase family protein [Actinobacteria bacterium]|nr:pyridoxamine 5'-phosphate oxidase family protein [Actinomycetota bacterium]